MNGNDLNDMRVSKVKKMNGDENSLETFLGLERKQTSIPEVPAALVELLEPTIQNNDEDEEDNEGLFGEMKKPSEKKKFKNIILDLENIQNLHGYFE